MFSGISSGITNILVTFTIFLLFLLELGTFRVLNLKAEGKITWMHSSVHECRQWVPAVYKIIALAVIESSNQDVLYKLGTGGAIC